MPKPMIDGYAHIGRPRFQSVENCLETMDREGIAKLVACPFETCPDIAEVHRAREMAPDRFRAFGLALGDDQALVERGMQAQFDAGFDGFRLSTGLIDQSPFVLDVIARNNGVPMVVGGGALASVAKRLVDFLDANPHCMILSPHLAGPTDPAILKTDGAVRALFGHPNFTVVASRQTMTEPTRVRAWMEALIEHVGWTRLMWGSEAPVLYWRDETVAQAAAWYQDIGAGQSQLDDFYQHNADRLIFGRPDRGVAPLRLPYGQTDFEPASTAPMWPHGFPADTRLPARLLDGWFAAGGHEAMPFSTYISNLLMQVTER